MFAIPAALALRLLLVLCAIADISATLRASTNNVETGVNARRQLQVDAFDESALCGCNSCSNDAPQNAGGFTCAHKIMGLIVDYRFTEAAACK